MRKPVGGAFFGFMVGVALVGLLIAIGVPPTDRRSSAFSEVLKSKGRPAVEENASEQLVNAWRNKLTGNYMVTSDFKRTASDGREISQTSISAKSGNDEVLVSGGDVTSTFDQKRLVCTAPNETAASAARSSCRGPVPVDPANEDEQELANVSNLVLGRGARYLVTQRPDSCFEVRARQVANSPAVALTALQWGNSAVFCFDEQSGAVTSSRIFKDAAIDVSTSKSIQNNITRNDLEALVARFTPR